MSTPIAIQVDSKLKNKIWQNMYIEFDKLLPKEDLNSEDMSVRLQSSGKSEFKLVKSKTKNTIKSIDQWTAAFLKFLGIHSEKKFKTSTKCDKTCGNC